MKGRLVASMGFMVGIQAYRKVKQLLGGKTERFILIKEITEARRIADQERKRAEHYKHNYDVLLAEVKRVSLPLDNHLPE